MITTVVHDHKIHFVTLAVSPTAFIPYLSGHFSHNRLQLCGYSHHLQFFDASVKILLATSIGYLLGICNGKYFSCFLREIKHLPILLQLKVFLFILAFGNYKGTMLTD